MSKKKTREDHERSTTKKKLEQLRTQLTSSKWVTLLIDSIKWKSNRVIGRKQTVGEDKENDRAALK